MLYGLEPWCEQRQWVLLQTDALLSITLTGVEGERELSPAITKSYSILYVLLKSVILKHPLVRICLLKSTSGWEQLESLTQNGEGQASMNLWSSLHIVDRGRDRDRHTHLVVGSLKRSIWVKWTEQTYWGQHSVGTPFAHWSAQRMDSQSTTWNMNTKTLSVWQTCHLPTTVWFSES